MGCADKKDPRTLRRIPWDGSHDVTMQPGLTEAGGLIAAGNDLGLKRQAPTAERRHHRAARQRRALPARLASSL
jgi:hypothetical protein